MKNAFLIILLFAGCSPKTATVKFNKTKLLLSEEVGFSDTSNNKKDTLYKIDYQYDSLNRMVKEMDTDYDAHKIRSHMYTYDTNSNLIEEQILDSGKTKIRDYTYVNGLPAYSQYRGSQQHDEDFLIIGTKIFKTISPQDHMVAIDTYEGNNLVNSDAKFPKFHLNNTYTYGKRRSEYYGRNSKWPHLDGLKAENETLQEKMLYLHNSYRYLNHIYTYNKYGYPIKNVELYQDSTGNMVGLPFITYYKYIIPSRK